MVDILIRRFTRLLMITLQQWGAYMQSNMSHSIFLILPIVTFLFIIWLVYRIENRAAKEVIYRNFPFFKDAVNSFQLKLEYLITRIDAVEDKIDRIENKIK
jgi:hypothetical protein